MITLDMPYLGSGVSSIEPSMLYHQVSTVAQYRTNGSIEDAVKPLYHNSYISIKMGPIVELITKHLATQCC